MHHVYWLDFLWNNHDWYKIDNLNDFVRALTWCGTNLLTSFCYIAIPYEIYKWRQTLKFVSSSMIGLGFIVFIFLCGIHHLVDVIIMPTAPWWAIISVNIPMAIASLLTYYNISRNRPLIIELLQELEDLFETKKVD